MHMQHLKNTYAFILIAPNQNVNFIFTRRRFMPIERKSHYTIFINQLHLQSIEGIKGLNQ